MFTIRPVSSAGNRHRISIVSNAGSRYSSIHSFINTHKAAEKYKTQYTHNKKEKVHKNTTQKHKT